MKFLLFTIAIFLYSNLFSQNAIEWGTEMDKAQIIKSFPISDSEFYTIELSTKMLESMALSLNYYKDGKIENSKKLRNSLSISNLTHNQVVCVNDLVYLFYNVIESKNTAIYVQIFDKKCEQIREPIKLLDSKTNYMSSLFDIIVSKNQQFIGINTIKDITNSNKVINEYKVFTRDLELISEGEYTYQKVNNKSKKLASSVSNNGDFYFVTSLQPNQKLFLYKKSKNHIDSIQVELDFSNCLIQDVKIECSQNEIITLSGTYRDNNSTNKQVGIFDYRVKFLNKECIYKRKETVNIDLTKYNTMGREELPTFLFKEIIYLADSSFIGIIEESIELRMAGIYLTNDPDLLRLSSKIYYSDIIAYKINSHGELVWINKVPKYQIVSEHQLPLSSSFSVFKDHNAMRYIFFDNRKNYDENGVWNGKVNEALTSTFRGNKLISVEQDIETGKIERKVFCDASEHKNIFYPPTFIFDEQSRKLMIFTDKLFGTCIIE